MTIPNARGASDTLVRVVREQSSLVRRLTCVRSLAVCAAPPSLATRSPHVARPRGPHVTWGPSLHARAPLPALLLVLPAGLLCPGGCLPLTGGFRIFLKLCVARECRLREWACRSLSFVLCVLCVRACVRVRAKEKIAIHIARRPAPTVRPSRAAGHNHQPSYHPA